jgi:hypothetical protein
LVPRGYVCRLTATDPQNTENVPHPHDESQAGILPGRQDPRLCHSLTQMERRGDLVPVHEIRNGYSPARLLENRQEGISYVWADTACIDKSCSEELSQAINLMFQWYDTAKICYAYLSDVEPAVDTSDVPEAFEDSAWWRRCWTLQELIAPREVVFYGKGWRQLGAKTRNLTGRIAAVTKIEEPLLLGLQHTDYYSVAQRMSWAADRKATRVEDGR